MNDQNHKLTTGNSEVQANQRSEDERRTGQDQREMIRFEPQKEPRRSGNDRRNTSTQWGSDKPV